jgi:predicted ferric reductase
MGLPLTGQTSAYWYMARAGGMMAYLLMWFSVAWGLLLSTKVAMKRVPPTLAYGIHEFASILTVIFAVIHAAVLLGDEYIGFNIFHLTIPFIAPYEPLWTGLGIIALYLTMAITASFYVRKQIGQKTWRALHYFTFAAYLLALVHGITAGSDSGVLVSALMYWGTGFSVLMLTQITIFQQVQKRLKKLQKQAA